MERLGLAADPVERLHEVAHQPLPQRLLGDRVDQLGHHLAVPSQRQLDLEAQLERGQPLLLQARRPALDGPPGKTQQGRAAPQVQGGTQSGRRLDMAPLGCLAGRRDDLVGEDLGVQAAGGRPDAVAGLLGHDQRVGPVMVTEHPAQRRDAVLHLAPGGVGRVLAPDRVDQAIHWYEPIGAEQQHSEHRPRPRPTQRDRLAVEGRPQRAEQVEGHHA